MTRLLLIEMIEKRIAQLNVIMVANSGTSSLNNQPYPKAKDAFHEWNVLHDTLSKLHTMRLP